MIPGKKISAEVIWLFFYHDYLIMVGEMKLDRPKESFFMHRRLLELQLGVWRML